jgi:hypothetical protein
MAEDEEPELPAQLIAPIISMQNWIGSLPTLERTRPHKQNYDRLGKVFMCL